MIIVTVAFDCGCEIAGLATKETSLSEVEGAGVGEEEVTGEFVADGIVPCVPDVGSDGGD